MDWHQIKHLLTVGIGLDMDALHVHVGVLTQIFVALALRRSIASPWPWLVLLAATLANEAYDLRYEIWPTRDDQWAESIKDGWNTMLLPTLLLLVSRFLPGLLARPPQPEVAAADEVAPESG